MHHASSIDYATLRLETMSVGIKLTPLGSLSVGALSQRVRLSCTFLVLHEPVSVSKWHTDYLLMI